MTTPKYIYSATVVDVHDGDTATLLLTAAPVDIGFGVTVTGSTTKVCRLLGMNARELAMPGGPEARDHLAAILAGGPLRVVSVRADKFRDRFDGLIYLSDGTSAADVMVHDGYAAVWDGKGVKPTPPWPRPA